jgi:hypothetical protein
MTALQLFRGALQLLSDSAAWTKGLSLSRQDGLDGALKKQPPPSMVGG